MARLTIERQQEIDSIIEDIYLRTDKSYPSNSLVEIARAGGINVYEVDLSGIGSNISGIIEYDEDKTKLNPRIFIESSESRERKMFTLAHELGHHFLHEGRKLRLDTLDYSSDNKDAHDESEANYFAASMLVPKQILITKINSGYNMIQLSDHFKVSLPVIRNRIKWIQNN